MEGFNFILSIVGFQKYQNIHYVSTSFPKIPGTPLFQNTKISIIGYQKYQELHCFQNQKMHQK